MMSRLGVRGLLVLAAALYWPAEVAALVCLAALLWLCKLAYATAFPVKDLDFSDEAEQAFREQLKALADRKRRDVA